MSFSIKAMCKHGELVHRRKTADAALKKARELSRTGCYDIYITTPAIVGASAKVSTAHSSSGQ